MNRVPCPRCQYKTKYAGVAMCRNCYGTGEVNECNCVCEGCVKHDFCVIYMFSGGFMGCKVHQGGKEFQSGLEGGGARYSEEGTCIS